jgi:hypothetical protein
VGSKSHEVFILDKLKKQMLGKKNVELSKASSKSGIAVRSEGEKKKDVASKANVQETEIDEDGRSGVIQSGKSTRKGRQLPDLNESTENGDSMTLNDADQKPPESEDSAQSQFTLKPKGKRKPSTFLDEMLAKRKRKV